MSKRGENIYKRKDGRWEGRYIKCRALHGKIQYGYIYGKSYSETKAKLKENTSTPIRASSSQATQSALYAEVLKAWLLSSKNRVKESTFSRYNHLVERHIQPLLGSYPISEISTVLLEECIDYLLENGRLDGNGGLSPKSVSDIIVVMKSSIRYALRNGYPVNCSPVGLSVKKSKKDMRVAVSIGIILWGTLSQGWGNAQLAGMFVFMGIFAGFVDGLSPSEIAVEFIKGASGITMGALVVGLARAILVILQGSLIIDTIIYPHAVIGCMSYNSTRKMNTAIKIGVVLVAVWSLSLSLLAGTIRNAFPDLAVSDYALPTLAVAALPHLVAGLTLAGVVGALQSTVGTMVIVMSAAVVKDLYQSVIKPDAKPKTMKNLTTASTIIITLVIFVLSLTPPDNLQNVVIYAVGGMVSAFYIPLMLGLYWMRANEWGALAGMVGGLATYLLNGMGVVNWKMGMEPIVIGVIVSLVLTVVVSLITPKSPYRIIDTWFSRNPLYMKDKG